MVFPINLKLLLFVFLYGGLTYAACNKLSIPEDTGFSSYQNSDSQTGFIENKGQFKALNGKAVPFVLFKSEIPGLNLWVTEKGITYQQYLILNKETDLSTNSTENLINTEKNQVQWERVDLELKGANIQRKNIIKEQRTTNSSNYYYPNCPDGITNVNTYQKITIKEVYRGIDWILYLNESGNFKYDFIVRPNANINDIQLIYNSKKPITLTAEGDLKMIFFNGDIKESKPVSFYQNQEITTHFKSSKSKAIKLKSSVGFETIVTFALEDLPLKRKTDLVIDPALNWGTFFEGSGNERITAMETDAAGNIFMCGVTSYIDFPLLDGGGGAYFDGTYTGASSEIILAKFHPDGTLLHSTFYGGTDLDFASDLNIDTFGNILICGTSVSADFPTENPGGGAFFQASIAGERDVIILKFNNLGIRIWATYYGGNKSDTGQKIITDPSGDIYITGSTSSTDFPTLDAGSGAFYQSSIGGFLYDIDAFILRFNTAGVRSWGTYIGGVGQETGYALTISSGGDIFMSGFTKSINWPTVDLGGGAYYDDVFTGGTLYGDTFLAKFNGVGILTWSTYFGGSIDDHMNDIIIDKDDNLIVTGETYSDDFPTIDPGMGAYFQGLHSNPGSPINGVDFFIAKFNLNSVLTWSTYFGGNDLDGIFGRSHDMLETDSCGVFYMSFTTRSTDIPTVEACDGGFYENALLGQEDVVITQFSPQNSLTWCSYWGGAGRDGNPALELGITGNLLLSGTAGEVPVITGYPLLDAGGTAYYDGIHEGYNTAILITRFEFTETVAVLTPSQINDSDCTCSGEATVNVSGTCPPYTYNWSTGTSVTNDTATNTQAGLCAGDYWVEVISNCMDRDTLFYSISASLCTLNGSINNDSICEGECTNLVVSVANDSGIVSFEWDNGIILNSDSINVCPAVTTTYQVIITDSIAPGIINVDTAFATVVVTPYPIVNLGADIISCETSFLIEPLVIDTTANFLWQDGSTSTSFNAISSGNYWVEVERNGCLTVDSINVLFGNANVFLGNDTLICSGDIYVLDAGLDSGVNYIWQDGSTTSSFSVTSPGVYYVQKTDSLGCVANDSITIEYGIGSAAFSYADTTGCRPLTTVFTDLSSLSSGSITSWLWEFGDGNTATDQNPVHSYSSSGTYIVNLTINTSLGCSYTISQLLEITIYEMPAAAFSYSPAAPLINDLIIFTNMSTASNSWVWDFGEGTTTSIENPTHTYETTNIYEVTLVASNNLICFDTTHIKILIDEPLIYFIPNTFTPDGDNLNAVFKPVFTSGFDPYDYNLTIYNRYGEIVFESYNANEGWNGTYGNNGIVQDGTYTWQIVFKDLNTDKKYIEIGHVNVLK